MDKLILKRDYKNDDDFEIDVTDYSLIDFIDLLRDKCALGGAIDLIDSNNHINLRMDNKRFFGRIERKKKTMEVFCGFCGGTGLVDSGGQDSNGNFIDINCPDCNTDKNNKV